MKLIQAGRSGRRIFACLAVATMLSCDRTDAPDVSIDPGPVTVVADSPYTTVHEGEQGHCVACVMQLREVAAFSGIDDAILLRGHPIVERDGEGRYYATVTGDEDHELIVYDSTGMILHTLDRFGSGPGEFRRIWDLMVDRHDSVFVGHDQRVSVFGPSGAFVRSVRLDDSLGQGPGLVGKADGKLILTARRTFASHDTTGLPFRVYDEDGSFLRAFGPRDFGDEMARRRGGIAAQGYRPGAWSPDGSLWLRERSGYLLTNIDLDGNVRRVIGVRPPSDWNLRLIMSVDELEEGLDFGGQIRVITPPSSVGREGSPMRTERRPVAHPSSIVSDLRPLDDRLLAVLIRVASTRWQEATQRYDTTRVLEGRPTALPGYAQQLYDTILDIVDGQTGTLLLRERIPGTAYLMRDATLYTVEVDEFDLYHVRAFRIELEGAPPSTP